MLPNVSIQMDVGSLLHYISTLIAVLFIPFSSGYDKTLIWDTYSCDFAIYDLTQHEQYLIRWRGTPFGVWCSVGFKGENPYNVETKYRVCVTPVRQGFTKCGPRVEIYDGMAAVWPTKRYDCSEPLPEKWCSKRDYVKVYIVAREMTRSYLDLKITVEADISLRIDAAIGIAFGCLCGLGLLCCCCCCASGCCKDEKPAADPAATRVTVHENNYDYRRDARLLPGNNQFDSRAQTDIRSAQEPDASYLLHGRGATSGTEDPGSYIPMHEYNYVPQGFEGQPNRDSFDPLPSAPPLPQPDVKDVPPPSYHDLFGKS